ncbi:polyketide cyclase [Nakamurella silvestris]|nr:polyketide cyclase [Nakamurella silvestris]
MSTSPKHATFTVEHRYALPPARVFAAWAEPELKARWFAGDKATHELDFRVGGREITRGNAGDGSDLTFASTYQEIRPAERIVYSSTLSRREELATVSVTTVEFLAESAGTTLVLTEYGVFLNEMEEPAWREQGTRTWLGQLTEQLTGS